jgi:hypothetical protein
MATIIRTTDGQKLRLSKTRLTQVQRDDYGIKCFLPLENLHRATEEAGVFVFFVNGRPSKPIGITYAPERYTIGCCTFTPSTFRQILRAAGVKTQKARR